MTMLDKYIRMFKLFIISDIELDGEYLDMWSFLEKTFNNLKVYETKHKNWQHLKLYGHTSKCPIMAYGGTYYKKHIFLNVDKFNKIIFDNGYNSEQFEHLVTTYLQYKYKFTCEATILNIDECLMSHIMWEKS